MLTGIMNLSFLAPYACILYDDQNGDGQEGQKGMIGETNLYDIENNFKFDVESVWIRENCRIEVYTGNCNCIIFHLSTNIFYFLHLNSTQYYIF